MRSLPETLVAVAIAGGSAAADEIPDSLGGPRPVSATAGAGTIALERVTVTARRRTEDDLVVPGAVDVVRGSTADAARVRNVNEVAALAPALTYVNAGNPVEALFFVRGLGSFGAGEPSVGTFVDGVYQSAGLSALQDLYDLERVEVVKGLQTTLFGKSSVAGAIDVVTRQPSDDPSASARALVGTQDLLWAQFHVNGPVAKGLLSARASGSHRQSSGFYEIASTGRPRDDERSSSVRVAARLTPSDLLAIGLSATVRERSGSAFVYHRVADDRDTEGEPYDIDKPAFADIDALALALPIDIALDGGYAIAVKLGGNLSRENAGADLDYTAAPPDAVNPFANVSVERVVDRRDISADVRLVSPREEPLRFQVGVFAYGLRSEFEQEIRIDTLIPIPPPPPQATRSVAQTYSAYGEVAFEPIAGIEYGLSLRYDADLRTQDRSDSPTGSESDAYHSVSPKGTVGWRPVEDALVYASAGLGWKPGGFNDGPHPPFGKERVVSYEVGAKAALLDRRVRLGAALFLNQTHDQQLFDFDPVTLTDYTRNEGEARTCGLDLDAAVAPLEGLTISARLTLLDARYTDYDAEAVAPDGSVGPQSFDGERLPYVPRVAVALAIQHEQRVGEELVLFGRIDYRVFGDRTWDNFGSVEQRPYGVLGAQAGARIGVLDIGAFIENALDEAYFTNFVAGYRNPLTGGASLAVNGAPRSYGVMATLRF